MLSIRFNALVAASRLSGSSTVGLCFCGFACFLAMPEYAGLVAAKGGSVSMTLVVVVIVAAK